MKRLRTLFLPLALSSGILLGPAAAAEHHAYSVSQFTKAQDEGKPILVDISASWCPVCKVQKSAIEREMSRPEFSQYQVFDVDFDSQKSVVQQFDASMQSTLIIFKGKSEKARLVGVTDPDIIDAMMRRATD